MGGKSADSSPTIPAEFQPYLGDLIKQQMKMLGTFGQGGWNSFMPGSDWTHYGSNDTGRKQGSLSQEDLMNMQWMMDGSSDFSKVGQGGDNADPFINQQGGQGPGDPQPVTGGATGAGGFNPMAGFWDPNARPIAGMDPLEMQALGLVQGMQTPEEYDRIRQYMENSGAMTPEWQSALSRAQNMNLLPAQTRQAVTESGGLNFLTPEHRAALGLYNDLGDLASKQVMYDPNKDRAFAAANSGFDSAIMPLIENQAALSGLGRSTSLNAATAAKKAETLLPLIQAGQDRAERKIDRQLGAGIQRAQGVSSIGDARRQGELARLGLLTDVGKMDDARQQFMVNTEMGAGDRRAGRQTEYMNNLFQLGDRNYGMTQDQIDYLSGFGGLRRGIQQDKNDAAYNDWLMRRQGFENSLYPWQGGVGSLLGGSSTQGKK